MTQLRQAMINAMQLRNFSENTQKAYIRAVKQLAVHYHCSPDNITEQQAQNYILYLAKEKNLTWGTCNVVVSSLRFFYKNVLHQSHQEFYLPFSKKEQRLPVILTQDEIRAILNVTKNHKHHALFMTIYGAGLRVSEATHLISEDIDSAAGVICIKQAKGKKDRYVPLPKSLLNELRAYWKRYRPGYWLFPGPNEREPITRDGVLDAFKRAVVKANIKKKVSTHSLRHAFATHLLEAGTDIVQIKELLGHSSLRSTLRYTKISKQRISEIGSPLDRL